MRVASSVLLVLLSACYTLTPVGQMEPVPGHTVIAQLSAPIEFQVVEARLQNITRVEGTLLLTTDDSLVVSAENLWSRAGVRHPALGARVAFARHAAEQLQEKRVSAGRTGLVIGAAAAVLAAVLFTVQAGGGGGTPNPGPGPKPQ